MDRVITGSDFTAPPVTGQRHKSGRAELERLKAQVASLRAENVALRRQLARSLGVTLPCSVHPANEDEPRAPVP